MMRDSDLLSAPLTVNWSLSYRCNFSCRHCYSRTWTDEPLALESVLRVIELLKEKGVVFVNFGGGEPLIDPRIYEIAAAAGSAGLKVTMNSNRENVGTLASMSGSNTSASISPLTRPIIWPAS